jgi:16S rRNA (cytosine1402-N4)-methyltransferase
MGTDRREQYIHTPVLLEEVVDFLKPSAPASDAPCVLVDATTGEGGHAEAFLTRFPGMRLYCVDADKSQLERARERLGRYQGRADFFNLWFSAFFKKYPSLAPHLPDRILFDLGISSRHYEESGRGFSFQKDEPLDMRLNPEGRTSAREIVNTWPEPKLAELFTEYGEERHARAIARAVGAARRRASVETTAELENIVWRAVPENYRRRAIHPATKVFQALRIACNRELEELAAGLADGFAVLKSGGRMGVISFHSLEDRIVKRFFNEKSRDCVCPPELPVCRCRGRRELELVTKKPVTAGEAETRSNPRARSAKLRVVEKCL